MPNHCYNLVEITGAGTPNVKKLLGSRKVLREGILRKLVPMPESLEGNISGGLESEFKDWDLAGSPEDWTSERGNGLTLDSVYEFSESSKTVREVFKAYSDALKETGHTSWYEWCIQHWGSKWGFYNVNVLALRKDKIEFRADAAWGPPILGLRKLAKLYDVTVEIETTEEACQYAYRGSFFPSGLAIEKELPGYLTPGMKTLTSTEFEKFQDLIVYEVDEEIQSLSNMSYQEYLQWNT